MYALTDPLDPPPSDERGFGDAPLESVVEEGVGAVFSPCPTAPAVDQDNLWRHEAVTQALMRGAAVLPTRFGTTLPDARRLRAVLARNRAAVRTGLEHVRGCVEVGVRVLFEDAGQLRGAGEPEPSGEPDTDGASPGAGVGRAYLVRRLAEDRRQRAVEQGAGAVAGAVHAPLARHARDAVRRPAGRPGTLTAAYLVDRDALEGFVALVQDLDGERADRHVLCTGPWPPYSFVPTLDLEGSLSA